MAEGRKQAISLRLNSGDIRRIKRLASRLGVRDSDVVRFAIKMMLSRMLPLTEPTVRGRRLVPVMADWGPEAVRHFELDAIRLDEIINGDADPVDRVDAEDIGLMLMVGTQDSYARLSLRALNPPAGAPTPGERRDDSPAGILRRHLYRKYGLAGSDGEGGSGSTRAPANVSLVKQGNR